MEILGQAHANLTSTIHVNIIYMSRLAVELRLGEFSQASAGPAKAETATFVRMTKQTWVRLQSTYLPIETECTRILLKLYHNKEDHLKFQVFNSNPEQAKKTTNCKAQGKGPKIISFYSTP